MKSNLVASSDEGRRLVSLDLLRGLTIAGMILVNATAGLFYSDDASVFPILLHAHWSGLTLADLVFPAFLTMVGVSIPFALARAAPNGLDRNAAVQIGGRTFRLVAIGFLLSNLYWFADFSSGSWRLFGVLQRIGIVYGACALIYLSFSTAAIRWLIAAILVLYWPLLLLPALDGLPVDIGVRGHNFAASVDRVLLGAGNHLYVKGPEGYDPEGVLGTIPAVAQCLIGVLVGLAVKRGRSGGIFPRLFWVGAGLTILGLVWSLWFPIIKDVWSSTFVLVTSGLTVLVLAVLHALVDRPEPVGGRLWLDVGIAFGSNAIAAYVLHMLTSPMVTWDLMLVPYRTGRHWLPEEVASLLPVFLYMALIWLVMRYLKRRNWVIKV